MTRIKKNPKPQLAISVRQPYAEQILTGRKTAEVLTWPTHVRGTVYLYAPKRLADGWSLSDLTIPTRGTVGRIVGTVEIVACTLALDEWGDDIYLWELGNPRRIRPVVPTGRPGPGFFGLSRSRPFSIRLFLCEAGGFFAHSFLPLDGAERHTADPDEAM